MGDWEHGIFGCFDDIGTCKFIEVIALPYLVICGISDRLTAIMPTNIVMTTEIMTNLLKIRQILAEF